MTLFLKYVSKLNIKLVYPLRVWLEHFENEFNFTISSCSTNLFLVMTFKETYLPGVNLKWTE